MPRARAQDLVVVAGSRHGPGFGARIDDPRLREALALCVDRAAIHNVLLQRQGEIRGALLPQWLSGLRSSFPPRPTCAGPLARIGSANRRPGR